MCSTLSCHSKDHACALSSPQCSCILLSDQSAFYLTFETSFEVNADRDSFILPTMSEVQYMNIIKTHLLMIRVFKKQCQLNSTSWSSLMNLNENVFTLTSNRNLLYYSYFWPLLLSQVYSPTRVKRFRRTEFAATPQAD